MVYKKVEVMTFKKALKESRTRRPGVKKTVSKKKKSSETSAAMPPGRMEKMKDAPVPEGEEPKSAVEIVEEVLKTKVQQSTFLRNVGLQSSRNNFGKATAEVAAHVRDLEQKLERSELQAEVMQEELAAIKMKAEEAEAARDKELELLCKKSQEQEEKLAHLMALFGAKCPKSEDPTGFCALGETPHLFLLILT
ncbi:hypothetical protein VPH35_015199 [Triticum aestivum]